MMVTSVPPFATTRPPHRNKTVYICCLVLFAMLAASPARGTDRFGTSTLLEPSPSAGGVSQAGVPQGKVSQVRVDRRTGKLVRTTTGGENPAMVRIAPPPAHIQRLVEKSARAHNVDPLLVESVMQVESNYNHYAVSPKGAEGLMQLMPQTARTLGVSNSFDPAQNIEAGVKYLEYLRSIYSDDRLVIAAYNAGPKAVEKYKWIPPYAETQNYVSEVGRRYRAAKRQQATAKSAVESAAPVAASVVELPSEEQHPKLEQHPRLEQLIDEHGRLVLRTAPR